MDAVLLKVLAMKWKSIALVPASKFFLSYWLLLMVESPCDWLLCVWEGVSDRPLCVKSPVIGCCVRVKSL